MHSIHERRILSSEDPTSTQNAEGPRNSTSYASLPALRRPHPFWTTPTACEALGSACEACKFSTGCVKRPQVGRWPATRSTASTALGHPSTQRVSQSCRSPWVCLDEAPLGVQVMAMGWATRPPPLSFIEQHCHICASRPLCSFTIYPPVMFLPVRVLSESQFIL